VNEPSPPRFRRVADFLLSDPLVRLRPPQPTDNDELCSAINESIAEMAPFLPWVGQGYSLEKGRIWLGDVCDDHHPAPQEIAFIIEQRPANVFAGAISLNNPDATARSVQIGYWMRTTLAGQGLMTAAVRLLTRHTLTTLGFTRVEILADPANAASCRVAEKAGLTFECLITRPAPECNPPHRTLRRYVITT
jgi:RimJ/RimL family protein N-acetyltransferase